VLGALDAPPAAPVRIIVPTMPLLSLWYLQKNWTDPLPVGVKLRVTTSPALASPASALGIEKLHVLGNSLGGMTGLKFAMEYPERLEKLMIMGAPTGGPRELDDTAY